jgi:hypothetical protein
VVGVSRNSGSLQRRPLAQALITSERSVSTEVIILCKEFTHTWNFTVHLFNNITVEPFRIKSTQVTTRPPSEVNDFFEIVVPIEISIPAKFYCVVTTIFLTADIQNCKKKRVFRHKLS